MMMVKKCQKINKSFLILILILKFKIPKENLGTDALIVIIGKKKSRIYYI